MPEYAHFGSTPIFIKVLRGGTCMLGEHGVGMCGWPATCTADASLDCPVAVSPGSTGKEQLVFCR